MLNSMHQGHDCSAKTLSKSLFHCQNDWSGHRPVLTFGRHPYTRAHQHGKAVVFRGSWLLRLVQSTPLSASQTTHMEAVSWEPHDSSPTACAGKANQHLCRSVCQVQCVGLERSCWKHHRPVIKMVGMGWEQTSEVFPWSGKAYEIMI